MRLRPHRALDRLSDARLHALLARVQTALFNRAPTSPTSPGLAVEIVDPAEGRLLALYRALPRAHHPQALAALASLWAHSVPPRAGRRTGVPSARTPGRPVAPRPGARTHTL